MVGGTEKSQGMLDTLLHVQMILIQAMRMALGMTYPLVVPHLEDLVDIQTRHRLVVHQPEMALTPLHGDAIDVTFQT